jgi:hypothetical protein
MSGEAMEIVDETMAQALSAEVEFDLSTEQALYAASRGTLRSRSSSADQQEPRPSKVTMTKEFSFFSLPSLRISYH